MFISFSQEHALNPAARQVSLSGLLFSLPKILKPLHQLIRLSNECIEQREVGIISHGRVELVRLRKGMHQHQPLFHSARRALDVDSNHGCQFS